MDWWNWHRNSGGAYMSLNGGRWQGIISCCWAWAVMYAALLLYPMEEWI